MSAAISSNTSSIQQPVSTKYGKVNIDKRTGALSLPGGGYPMKISIIREDGTEEKLKDIISANGVYECKDLIARITETVQLIFNEAYENGKLGALRNGATIANDKTVDKYGQNLIEHSSGSEIHKSVRSLQKAFDDLYPKSIPESIPSLSPSSSVSSQVKPQEVEKPKLKRDNFDELKDIAA
jgi:hypothetical protein